MTIHRRSLMLGLVSSLAAPAIVHACNIMPVRLFQPWSPTDIPGLVYWEHTSDHISRCLTVAGYFDEGQQPAHQVWLAVTGGQHDKQETLIYNRPLTLSEHGHVEEYLRQRHHLPYNKTPLFLS